MALEDSFQTSYIGTFLVTNPEININDFPICTFLDYIKVDILFAFQKCVGENTGFLFLFLFLIWRMVVAM